MLKAKVIINYILVYLMIAESAIPLFMNKLWNVAIFLFSFLIYLYYGYYRNKFSKNTAGFYFLLFSVLLLQLAYFGNIYFLTFILQILLFTTPYFVLQVVSVDFCRIYVQIVYFFTIISFVFYVGIVLYPTFFGLFVWTIPQLFVLQPADNVYHFNIIIYHIIPELFDNMRNNGPFWEPGVFGGLLLVAIFFETTMKHKFLTTRNIVFSIAVITTFSTTSYIALFLFIFGYNILDKKNLGRSLIIAPIVLALFFIIYNRVPFLRDKITHEIENTENDVEEQGGNTRTASAYLDIKELFESGFYVFIGRGSHPGLRVEGTEYAYRRNNGLTDLLAKWGVVFALVYLLKIYLSFKDLTYYYRFSRNFALLGFSSIVLLSLSEPYFRYPLFISFIFLADIFKNYQFQYLKKRIDRINNIEVQKSNNNVF